MRVNEIDVRIRISDYINKYNREYGIRQTDIINLGSTVMLVKPYNISIARRQPLESIYFNDLFVVLSINNENYQIKNIKKFEIINANIRCLKKLMLAIKILSLLNIYIFLIIK